MSKNDELASTLRTMINIENEQIHRRLTYLNTIQGFLFAALGFGWDKNRYIVVILALIGFLIALLILIALIGAGLAVRKIVDYWQEHKPARYNGPEIIGFYPYKAPFSVFTSPENLIPIVFMTGWMLVLGIYFGGWNY